MYGGFSIRSDGLSFSMPCRWCGQTIAESVLEERLNLSEGELPMSDLLAVIEHIKKRHPSLVTLDPDGIETILQECELCHNRAT